MIIDDFKPKACPCTKCSNWDKGKCLIKKDYIDCPRFCSYFYSCLINSIPVDERKQLIREIGGKLNERYKKY